MKRRHGHRVRRIHGAFAVRYVERLCDQRKTYRRCVKALFHEWSRQLEEAAKDKPKWTMADFPKLGQKDDGEGVA